MDQNPEHKVTFDGENYQSTTRHFEAPSSGITGWLIEHSGGVIRDEKQATLTLIAIIIVCIAVSAFLLSRGDNGADKFQGPPGTAQRTPTSR
jgi:hypothetical protein